jgi:hypothetical protein
MDIRQEEIQAMKEIVDVCVGIPLFTYEMQINAPRPTGEYAAIKCISSLNPGYDESKVIEVGGVEKFRTRGIRVLTFMILFSREGDEFIRFDNSFYRPDVHTIMRSKGFAALGKTTLDLSSITLETNWEFRQGIKMQFNIIRESVSDIGIMDNASVGGKFIDGDQVITIKGI